MVIYTRPSREVETQFILYNLTLFDEKCTDYFVSADNSSVKNFAPSESRFQTQKNLNPTSSDVPSKLRRSSKFLSKKGRGDIRCYEIKQKKRNLKNYRSKP